MRRSTGCEPRQSDREFVPREGVLVLTAGTNGNVVRLLPPLVIADDLLTKASTSSPPPSRTGDQHANLRDLTPARHA
jgi:hypothetical protein